MQPPWRLPGLKGAERPHQREWSGQGAALSWPREYAGEYHTNAQGLYKWALPCFLRRLLCSKILPSIEALSHFPAQLPRKFQSRNPDAPQTATGRRRAALTALGGPDAPQTATGRRRAALTALGAQMPPDRHRTPESGPDGSGAQMPPDRHRTPESGPDGPRGPRCPPDRHRTPESGPDGPRGPRCPPDRHRTPESGPDGPRGPRCPPDRHRTPESGPDGPRGPDAPRPPQDAGERP